MKVIKAATVIKPRNTSIIPGAGWTNNGTKTSVGGVPMLHIQKGKKW